MSYRPLNYEKLNLHTATYQPNTIKPYNNQAFNFWEKQLFHRWSSVIDLTLPKEWQGNRRDFLFYCLARYGYVAVSENATYGYFFQPANLKGYDLYYQPTNALITNPVFNESKDLVIGEQCELLRLTPDYQGVFDIITYYAEKLAILDNAINISLINNKFAFVLGAKNKQSSMAIKKMLDKINQGEPAVIYDMKITNDPTDKDTPFQFLERSNLKQSYLTTDQLTDFQTILNSFDTEVGIPTVPYQKKERMVTSEADSKVIESSAKAQVWIECLNSSIDKIHELYPDLTLSAKLRYPINEGGADNGNIENNDNRL